MRKSTPQPIGDILKGVVEGLSQSKRSDAARAFSSWPQIAGRKLARHTRPVALKKETLVISVDESAWLYQANLEKNKLLKALQQKIGVKKVNKIQFRIGNIR